MVNVPNLLTQSVRHSLGDAGWCPSTIDFNLELQPQITTCMDQENIFLNRPSFTKDCYKLEGHSSIYIKETFGKYGSQGSLFLGTFWTSEFQGKILK